MRPSQCPKAERNRLRPVQRPMENRESSRLRRTKNSSITFFQRPGFFRAVSFCARTSLNLRRLLRDGERAFQESSKIACHEKKQSSAETRVQKYLAEKRAKNADAEGPSAHYGSTQPRVYKFRDRRGPME